ncbi:MAG: HmuY family protein [Deltaproteobacteria bacterium]|nr:HmuY family protein [Deltaproteobacteria bacterium]
MRLRTALLSLLAAGLLGCPTGPDELETVTVTLENGTGFVDLQGGSAVAEADGWDIKLDGWNLFLNGGESGNEKAGGIDMELLDLEMQFEDMNRRNQIVWFLFFDSYACALSDWWWYGLDGTHTLFSNYHAYVVRRDDRDFAVQILDYYRVIDGAVEAGYPEFRWAEIPTDGSEPVVSTVDLDATAGGLSADPDDPSNQWTYFSFDGGELALTDSEALADDTLDLGFKRFNIKSNSGPSGPASVTSVDPDRERGETGEEVMDFTAANQEQWFLDSVDAWDGGDTQPFVEDAVQPVLRRWYQGLPGSADEPVSLWDGRWFLATDRTGEQIAKLRVIGFEGDAAAGPDSLTLEWAVLP